MRSQRRLAARDTPGLLKEGRNRFALRIIELIRPAFDHSCEGLLQFRRKIFIYNLGVRNEPLLLGGVVLREFQLQLGEHEGASGDRDRRLRNFQIGDGSEAFLVRNVDLRSVSVG